MKTRKELEEKLDELEAQIKPLQEVLTETRRNYEIVKIDRDDLHVQLDKATQKLIVYENLKKAIVAIFPTGEALPNRSQTLLVTDQETVFQVEKASPEVIEIVPNTNEGKILWAVFKLGKPSSISEIFEYLNESKKTVSMNSLSPTLVHLVEDGKLIKEGEKKGVKYRFGKFVKVKEK